MAKAFILDQINLSFMIQLIVLDQSLPINDKGECVVSEEVIVMKNDKQTLMHKYKCSARCRPLTKDEVESILSLKLAFDNPIDEIVHTLYNFDADCPKFNIHHNRVFGPEGISEQVAKLSHPLVCYNDSGCRSNLRILRCGAVHYPVRLHFFNQVYSALREYSNVKVIDTALGTGDCTKLMHLTKTIEYCDLLSNDVETS